MNLFLKGIKVMEESTKESLDSIEDVRLKT